MNEQTTMSQKIVSSGGVLAGEEDDDDHSRGDNGRDRLQTREEDQKQASDER